MNDQTGLDQVSEHPPASGDAGRDAAGVRPRWGLLLVGCVLVVVALALDRPVTDRLGRADGTSPIEPLLRVLLDAGPCVLMLAILASFPNGWRLCVGFLAPVLLHLPVLHFLKWAIGRARPLAELGAFHFEPFSATDYCDAFPSGHSASAAILALLLGMYFRRARWVFYVMAGLLGLERVVTDWHYLSDVIAGYVLAGLVVYVCVHMLGPAYYQKELPRG